VYVRSRGRLQKLPAYIACPAGTSSQFSDEITNKLKKKEKWADIKISAKRSTYLVAEIAERCQYHTNKKS
tara:strand:- start:147 stop:356 length:210 start_codon:yes stop_codon:yes gene_type:complete